MADVARLIHACASVVSYLMLCGFACSQRRQRTYNPSRPLHVCVCMSVHICLPGCVFLCIYACVYNICMSEHVHLCHLTLSISTLCYVICMRLLFPIGSVCCMNRAHVCASVCLRGHVRLCAHPACVCCMTSVLSRQALNPRQGWWWWWQSGGVDPLQLRDPLHSTHSSPPPTPTPSPPCSPPHHKPPSLLQLPAA